MAINLAVKTKMAIDAALEADQGATYRQLLEQVIPHIGDAYRGADEGFRSHLGASMIGRECAREIWYGFRWVHKAKFPGKILRLFNRGHLEEARFIALLLMIGVVVYQQDEKGDQFRISEVGGHFGGSGDGVGINIPDLQEGQPALLEFKTHNDKSFTKLQENGVREAKPEHFAQMQIYMRKMGIPSSLYGAVNKNNDELHLEILTLESYTADQFLDRGKQIILMRSPPDKLNSSPGWWKCKFCNMKQICHHGADPEVNCRTCHFVRPEEDGTWRCGNPEANHSKGTDILSKEDQLAACKHYLKF